MDHSGQVDTGSNAELSTVGSDRYVQMSAQHYVSRSRAGIWTWIQPYIERWPPSAAERDLGLGAAADVDEHAMRWDRHSSRDGRFEKERAGNLRAAQSESGYGDG